MQDLGSVRYKNEHPIHSWRLLPREPNLCFAWLHSSEFDPGTPSHFVYCLLKVDSTGAGPQLYEKVAEGSTDSSSRREYDLHIYNSDQMEKLINSCLDEVRVQWIKGEFGDYPSKSS